MLSPVREPRFPQSATTAVLQTGLRLVAATTLKSHLGSENC